MSAAAIDRSPEMRAAAGPRLELRGITKSYPGVRALSDVSFGIWSGETHMLLGENGAGKSTLMKVLCGAVRADSGEILYENRNVTIASPADARRLGIGFVQGCISTEIAIRSLRHEAVPKKVTQPSVVVTKVNLGPYDVPVDQRTCPSWDQVPQN
jgi:ABC-type glutathione transport system ATPase component